MTHGLIDRHAVGRLKILIRVVLLVLLFSRAGDIAAAASSAYPSIIYILCDDLGFGDVRCLNPQGKIPTPNMDRLATQGMTFTDAHSSSSVCTPTRYGILTGRYNWRSTLKRGVLAGFSPRLIEDGRLTVASLLKNKGYATACIGKWHLGLNWPHKQDAPSDRPEDKDTIDYSRPIAGGPLTLGFDYFFGIAASLDMFPFTYIENDRVAEVPTVEKEWLRKGPAGQTFEAEDVLPELTRRAVAYINGRATEARAGRPFFLYLPLTAPHTPILPTGKWQGKSRINPYADFVMQTDSALGEVLDAIDRHELAQNTLVIFTSDNGCSPAARYPELLAKGHNPSAQFRGTKADIFDGGHRIPFMVRWPAVVKPGTKSDQIICLTDLMATCAEITRIKLPDNAGEDSVSFLPALNGTAKKPLRDAIVHHSINGSFAIRQGKWKLALCGDSGGWSDPKPGSPEAKALSALQLYDLSNDIGERNNVQALHPEVVTRLSALLDRYVADGRSTPGKAQTNTALVTVNPAGKRSQKKFAKERR